MDEFILESEVKNEYIQVNQRFICDYMIHANGEFVKVYLMLLYYLSDNRRGLSLKALGDALEQSEKAVIRALKYWEQMKLLGLKLDDKGNVCGICIKDFAASSDLAVTKEEVPSEKVSPDRKLETVLPDTKADIMKVTGDEDFAALIVGVQQYIGTTLNRTNVEALAYLYDILGLPVEVIEYLVEVCVGEGHRSIRYIEKVGCEWYSRGIRTLEQAKVQGVVQNKDVYTVMKSMGLSGRYPTPSEKTDIDRWLRDYGFDVNVVLEACKRTMDKLHNADFRYVEGILRDWKRNNVKSMSDVKKLDDKYQENIKKPVRDANTKEQPRKNTAQNNRFHNFEQRNVDYEDMKIDINDY